MWLGSYEFDMQRAIVASLRAGMVFYDLGANVGFFSLLAARYVGTAGHVYAFEPLARNLEYLNRHIELNGVSNITVVPKAVADRAGTAGFAVRDHSTSHLCDAGEVKVEVTTLDSFCMQQGVRPPDIVKVDIEGAEIAMLRGGARCLAERTPVVFMSVHSEALYAQLFDLIDPFYRAEALDGRAAGRDAFRSEVVLRRAADPAARRGDAQLAERAGGE